MCMIYIYIIISYIHICKSTIDNHACRNVTFPSNSGGTGWNSGGTGGNSGGTRVEIGWNWLELGCN